MRFNPPWSDGQMVELHDGIKWFRKTWKGRLSYTGALFKSVWLLNPTKLKQIQAHLGIVKGLTGLKRWAMIILLTTMYVTAYSLHYIALLRHKSCPKIIMSLF